MSIEVGNLVTSYNGKGREFYGFVSAKEELTLPGRRPAIYYSAKPLIYDTGAFVKRPKTFKSQKASLTTPELVRLRCLLFQRTLENVIRNAQLPGEDNRDGHLLEMYLNLHRLMTVRYNSIYQQLDNYIDPRGI